MLIRRKQRTKDGLSQLLLRNAALQISKLEESGWVYEAEKTIKGQELTLAMSTDSGGKEHNQDSAAMFVPRQPSPVYWAVAIADGITSSLESDLGSRLACLAALTVIKMFQDAGKPPRSPILSCQRYFNTLGERVCSSPDEYRPADSSQSGWARTVRDGRFAQTTLLVLWCDDRGLHFEGLGDGGFWLSVEPGMPPMLFRPDSSGPVNCLGPLQHVTPIDFAFQTRTWEHAALFTDGLGDVVAANDVLGLTTLEPASENPASSALQHVLEQDVHHDIEDNVTFFFASRREP